MEERKRQDVMGFRKLKPPAISCLCVAGKGIRLYILTYDVDGEHQLAFIVIKASPMLANEKRLGKMTTQYFLDHSNKQR